MTVISAKEDRFIISNDITEYGSSCVAAFVVLAVYNHTILFMIAMSVLWKDGGLITRNFWPMVYVEIICLIATYIGIYKHFLSEYAKNELARDSGMAIAKRFLEIVLISFCDLLIMAGMSFLVFAMIMLLVVYWLICIFEIVFYKFIRNE